MSGSDTLITGSRFSGVAASDGGEASVTGEEAGRRLPLGRSDAALDLRDVDAAGRERVAIGEEREQEARDLLVAAQVGDEDGRVEQVDAQADSVRRVFRTQAAVARRSRQCR